jgi:hypothetical protein
MGVSAEIARVGWWIPFHISSRIGQVNCTQSGDDLPLNPEGPATAKRVTQKPQVIFNPGLGPKTGLYQSKERRNRYAQFSPFWRRLLKDSITWEFSGERYDGASTPVMNCARPPALVVWWGRLRLPAAGSSRSVARSRDVRSVIAP